MKDIVLVTVESLRHDYSGECTALSRLDTAEGISAGHYTRPSLAGLLSGQYRSALATRVQGPTLASQLSAAGFETAGVSYSPQTTPVFGFDDGFDHFECVDLDSDGPASRGSQLREFLGQSNLVRAVYRRVQAKHSTMAQLPTDKEAVSTALRIYRKMSSPRFLWLHLMGSHRPYGRGDEALPEELDRAAAAASPSRLTPTLTGEEHDQVAHHYCEGVQRVSASISRLLDNIDTDARVLVAGDHGEELGESGYYYHGGYRRRVADAIIRVPIGTRNLSPPSEQIGLAAVPALLAEAANVQPPEDWVNTSNDSWLTLAPWHERASVAVTSKNQTLRLHDGEIGDLNVSDRRPGSDVAEQLRALGYVDAG